MATEARDWRDLITPEIRARAEAVTRRLASTTPTLPADITPAEMGEISIARFWSPDATIEDILGDRPSQGRLELHMTGAGVKGHGVASKRFSAFLARMDDALSLTARTLAQNERRSSRFIFAAVEPGSLSFELRAPDVEHPDGQDPAVEVQRSTVDSDALRAVTTVLTESTHGDDDELESAIGGIPFEARGKLFNALDHVAASGWEIDGSLRQHDFQPVHLEVPLQATRRLRDALKEKTESLERTRIDAEISGFRREEGLIWLAPIDGAPRFPASAANHRVLRAAREAGAHEGTVIRADVTIEKRIPKHESAVLRTSRVITDLSIIAAPRQLPLSE